MPPVPKMIYYSIPSAALGMIERIHQETKPVATEFPQPTKITQTGESSSWNSLRSDRRIDDEQAEADDGPRDNRPEWQKIGARGGRSRPNRKR